MKLPEVNWHPMTDEEIRAAIDAADPDDLREWFGPKKPKHEYEAEMRALRAGESAPPGEESGQTR